MAPLLVDRTPKEIMTSAATSPSADSRWWPLSAWVRWLALAGLVVSFWLPPEGFGFDVCVLHRATGLPCPGCGLTRAVALVSQGDLRAALGANPFVLLAWPLLALLGAGALLPRGALHSVERWGLRHHRLLEAAARVGLLALAGFGALRFLAFLLLGERFP